MDLSTLDKTQSEYTGDVERDVQQGKTGEILDRQGNDIRTLTKMLESFSHRVVLVPVDLLLLRGIKKEDQATAFCNDDKLFQALRSGSVACFTRDIPLEEANSVGGRSIEKEYSINRALRGKAGVVRRELHYLQGLPSQDKALEVPNAPLTRRETQTLRYMAEGYSNKQIARALCVSEQTVKNHVSSVQHKLGANNRTHAVVLALKLGCIEVEDPISIPDAQT